MSGLKRKVSQELSRSSADLVAVEPDSTSYYPSFMKDYASRSLSWCRDLVYSITGQNTTPPSPAVMPQATAEVVTETHKETTEQRTDGQISIKRQLIRRPKSAKTISAALGELEGPHKAGRGVVDYKGCATEEDRAKRNDDFWAPPDFDMLDAVKASKIALPRTPEGSDDEESGKQEVIAREILPPRTPESMSPPAHIRQSPRAKLHHSPISNGRPSKREEEIDEGDVRIRLEGLLVTSEDDRKDGLGLAISSSKSEVLERERKKRGKERAAQEKEAALLAAKKRRLTRRNPSRRLVQPLDNRWEAKVLAAKDERNPEKELAQAIQGTPIRGKDFKKLLLPRSWLNDEIVNGYFECIQDKANKDAVAEAEALGEPVSSVPKFLVHNSFFWTTITEKGVAQTDRLMKRRKVIGKSLLEVDTMFVPICKNSHWTLGVLRPIARTIEYLDSFGGSGEGFVRKMREFLKHTLKDAYIDEEWKTPETRSTSQNNGYDCGVFACTNGFCVAFGLNTSCYEESDLIQQRKNIAAVLINKGFHGDFELGGL